MDLKQKAKLIRKAVRESGVNYVVSYNDKNKDHRRLKCIPLHNLYTDRQYDEWLKAINLKLKEYGVEVISSYFESCHVRCGARYIAYVARFN